MQIWVDADACPGAVKDVLFRAAERREVDVTLVANRAMHVPASPWIRFVKVKPGFDVADHEIAQRLSPGDLVITADVPLAAEVVELGAVALNPRGTLYTEENVGELLASRDLLDQLRTEGVVSGGPPPFGASQVREFSNQLDRWLTRQARETSS